MIVTKNQFIRTRRDVVQRIHVRVHWTGLNQLTQHSRRPPRWIPSQCWLVAPPRVQLLNFYCFRPSSFQLISLFVRCFQLYYRQLLNQIYCAFEPLAAFSLSCEAPKDEHGEKKSLAPLLSINHWYGQCFRLVELEESGDKNKRAQKLCSYL